FNWRPVARPTCARSAHQSRPVLRPARVANHAGVLRDPRDLFLVAVLARIFRDVTAALEISLVGAEHCASWRNRLFTCLVPRGGRSILSCATFYFALSLSPSARGHSPSVSNRYWRHHLTRFSGCTESISSWRRRIVPRLSSMDLLSTMDPARSARIPSASGRDREISTDLLERR